MGHFETMMRRRIAEAESDAHAFGPSLGRIRGRDAESLRRILRAWDGSLTPTGRLAAELGIPTGPFDGGIS